MSVIKVMDVNLSNKMRRTKTPDRIKSVVLDEKLNLDNDQLLEIFKLVDEHKNGCGKCDICDDYMCNLSGWYQGE